MSRFHQPPDPRFWNMNRSIGFDYRLAAYDVRQSRAHVKALLKLGVLDESEHRSLDGGLEAVGAELESGSFPWEDGDEDVHMAIERRLGEITGPVARKIHTGRSRNDQVATDMAMAVRDSASGAIDALTRLMGRVLELAEAHRDWRMPGYTHLQRAQPVYLGHHLMAYFWMSLRDRARFERAHESASVLPLGSGALAGVNWDLDRGMLAAELGFTDVTPNSLDGSSNRDFVLDFLSAAAICSTHLSRLGSELVIWSSSEFSFCELAEPFSSGSSIMPQKKNPDSAELLRAKPPRVIGDLTALLGVFHALPLTYGKDMQEDKEPFFDAADTIAGSLEMACGMLEEISFDRSRLEDSAGDEMLAATELADLLVRHGVSFRDAHGIVGELVRKALESGRDLSELEPGEVSAETDAIDFDSYRSILDSRNWIESKQIEGGTSSEALSRQFDKARQCLPNPLDEG